MIFFTAQILPLLFPPPRAGEDEGGGIRSVCFIGTKQ
jgi:hypothetical protein